MSFSAKGKNINVEGNAKSDGCEAVVAAIDSKVGLVHYLQKKRSIKKDDYEIFLRGLASKCNEKLIIFADNCSIHKSKVIAEVMNELNIVPIWNLPYR